MNQRFDRVRRNTAVLRRIGEQLEPFRQLLGRAEVGKRIPADEWSGFDFNPDETAGPRHLLLGDPGLHLRMGALLSDHLNSFGISRSMEGFRAPGEHAVFGLLAHCTGGIPPWYDRLESRANCGPFASDSLFLAAFLDQESLERLSRQTEGGRESVFALAHGLSALLAGRDSAFALPLPDGKPRRELFEAKCFRGVRRTLARRDALRESSDVPTEIPVWLLPAKSRNPLSEGEVATLVDWFVCSTHFHKKRDSGLFKRIRRIIEDAPVGSGYRSWLDSADHALTASSEKLSGEPTGDSVMRRNRPKKTNVRRKN